MEQEKKIEYIKAALALQSINCDDYICDTIITTYEKIMELGGKFSLSDAADIKMSLKEKHFPKKENRKKQKK
jgi:hypothetical protein